MFGILYLTKRKYESSKIEENDTKMSTQFELPNRFDCTETPNFCFTDNDCMVQCTNSTTFKCIKGLCRNTYIYESSITNNCNPRQGMLGFLVGNPMLGKYDYICKSIDPGIALDNGKVLMCDGQTPPININYLSKYPDTNQCTCENKMYIPATSVKRGHYQCSNYYTMTKIYD